MKIKRVVSSGLNLALTLILMTPSAAFTDPTVSIFTLETYLKQVKAQNKTMIANSYLAQSYRLRQGEASLDFMPYAVGSANYSDDKRIGSFNSALGTEAIGESGTLGVQTKLRTGTTVGFNYNLALTQIYNSPFYGVQNYVSYTAAPQITFNQPLWKDFNASLSKANEDSIISSLKAQETSSQYSNQQIIFNAENAYWALALEREIVRLDRESIERTDKILKRNQKRVSMNVADKSDLLQSLASLKTKELAYQKDMEDLREANLNFNSLRNVADDSVTENLQSVDGLLDLDISKEIIRKGERADVKVALANAATQRAHSKASEIANQPDIELMGTYQFNGRGSNTGIATGTSWNGDNPYWTAGLTLKIPLDQGEVSRMNDGYRAQVAATEATIERAKFDLDQDWIDLTKHFRDAMSRLSLAKELEKLQAEKLKWERERFSSGRTTSFQVLQFEDNFSDASLSRLRVENELIVMRAKAHLYNGDVR